ncbi:DUF427 domain-containing protein [[Mycobacterium] wendilense]|uniref:DUF427 domain-containing protein n=1 Tax=[Mycobacterium] wendilense TaxID=3064284 RepID=A0ABN9P6G4_9MYCO|nr:DUF427 domain-containing protein [Mycolicibacterium sp. MU0050]CAJ1586782.1 DUF427 domain-containing protein [Mycolicibacterium sp. MU0050]
MSLVAGRGPFGSDPAGWFTPPVPADVVFVEPHPRRVQAVRDGSPVIDTEDVLLVHRRGRPLSYAFPSAAVADLPAEPVAEAPGYVTVPWAAVDSWFEEGRQLVHYPPNPYHRVDCRPTTRGLRVSVGATTLVDTTETVIVFETSLAPRLYVAPAQVRMDLLRPTATTSYCNYKGHTTYWAVTLEDGTTVEDIAWSYDDPLPESLPIKGFLSFDAERVQMLAELPGGTGGDCGCPA